MIKRTAISVLSRKPIWPLLLKRAQKGADFSILCYHTLGPDTGGINGWTVLRQCDFRRQLQDLTQHYDIVSLDDAISTRGQGSRPRLVITFDDGDRGLAKYLAPILSERPVPITVYIATLQFVTQKPLWFDRVVNAAQYPARIQIDGLGQWELPGNDHPDHWTRLGGILEAIKAAPTDQRDRLAGQVVAQGKAGPPPLLGPMEMDDLKSLANTPGVTIGAHTHGHELLDQIADDQARESIAHSRQLLADWTGQEIRHFAFPNGNYTPELCEMVRSLGFVSAAVLEERLVPRNFDPYALPRISIGRYDSDKRVRLRLAGM